MRSLIIFNPDTHQFGYITQDENQKHEKIFIIEIPETVEPKDKSQWESYKKNTFQEAQLSAQGLGFNKVVDPKVLAKNRNQKVYGGDMYGFIKHVILESARIKSNGSFKKR